ncbi:MAG: phage tail assembly protein [Chloroflexi bacterium]|nr:phage tail assembly protein [Chloroflexota bacterium]
MQTEFAFELPRGYVDGEGRVHRQGVMRLATAMDEIAPLRDMRVRANEAYLAVLLLSRVITQLGDLPQVTTMVIENLFAADMAYLQDFYRRINEAGTNTIEVICPNCRTVFREEIVPLGE